MNKHALSLLVVLAIASCSAPTPPQLSSITESDRERFGTVGVISLSHAKKAELDVPLRGVGRGAAEGTARGVEGGALGGVYAGLSLGPIGIFLMPYLVAGGAVVGGVAGGIAGGVAAVPEEVAKEIEREISDALVKSDPELTVRRNIVEIAEKEGVSGFKEITRAYVSTAETTNYRSIPNLDVDTILEVKIIEVGLSGGRGSDPKLTLVVRASVRLIDLEKYAERVVYPKMTYSGPTHPFTVWGAEKAKKLRVEVQRAYYELAKMVFDNVFLQIR